MGKLKSVKFFQPQDYDRDVQMLPAVTVKITPQPRGVVRVEAIQELDDALAVVRKLKKREKRLTRSRREA